METKRFIGKDMRRLYDRVREEFGPDAIIVRTRSLARDGAEPLIELVAAPPNASAHQLSLDLQRQLVGGALNRLHLADSDATVGDLEEIASREEAFPEPAFEEPFSEEWFEGLLQDDGHQRALPPATREPLRIPFGPLDEIEDELPPANDWAVRPRPALPAHEPDEPVIGFVPERTYSPLRDELLAAGLSLAAADEVLQRADSESDPVRALAAAIGDMDVRFPGESETALITIQGPTGAGRTTALLRMARDCADAGREALLVAADRVRPAAREELRAAARRLRVPVFDAEDERQLRAVHARAERGACLFVDVPAGPYTPPRALAQAHYSYFAIPAHWQAEAVEWHLEQYARASFAGCVITGADLVTDLSPAISLAVSSGWGIAFLSSGRDITTGIETADAIGLALGILRQTSGVRTNGRLATSA